MTRNVLVLVAMTMMTVLKFSDTAPVKLRQRSVAQSDEILRILDVLEKAAKNEMESTIEKMNSLTKETEEMLNEAKDDFESNLRMIEEMRQLLEEVPPIEDFEEESTHFSEQDIVEAEEEQENENNAEYLDEDYLVFDEDPSELDIIMEKQETMAEEEGRAEEGEKEESDDDKKPSSAAEVIEQLNRLIDNEEHMDEMDREESTNIEEMAVETMIEEMMVEEKIARGYVTEGDEADESNEEDEEGPTDKEDALDEEDTSNEENEEDAADEYLKELGFL